MKTKHRTVVVVHRRATVCGSEKQGRFVNAFLHDDQWRLAGDVGFASDDLDENCIVQN